MDRETLKTLEAIKSKTEKLAWIEAEEERRKREKRKIENELFYLAKLRDVVIEGEDKK